MYYITGDTHGDLREVVRFCKRHMLTEDDTIIVLGDAGINYFGNKRDLEPRKQLGKTPATIFCIHGNHERRPQSMDIYSERIWRGGTVFREDEYPNILFAKDGEVFNFNGLKAIVIGGAYSIDKQYRLSRGWSWFPDEQPNQEIKSYVKSQLEKYDWKIDIVLSHTCPLKYEPTEVFLEGVDQGTVDKSTEIWLDSIEEKLDYKHWYCGHFHTTKRIDKIQFMFHDFDVLRTSNSDDLQLKESSGLSGSQIFYTSDLHLGHANIIKLCDRPFSGVEEMNSTLIDNWNARVRPIDQIFIVGDFAFRSSVPAESYLEQLNGIKHLIIGNHDSSWIKKTNLSRYFESADMMDEIRDKDHRVILCHYPLMTWPGRDSYMIYGHIHNSKDSKYWPLLRTMDHALNACVEVNGYQPVTLDELIDNGFWKED